MMRWWNDKRIQNFFYLGFAIGVAYKFILWHVLLPHSIIELAYEMPVRYMLQYITSGFLGGFACAYGAYIALRRKR